MSVQKSFSDLQSFFRSDLNLLSDQNHSFVAVLYCFSNQLCHYRLLRMIVYHSAMTRLFGPW